MRIYCEPSDQLLFDLNKAVKEKGIGKSQIVLEALDQYLHGNDHDLIAIKSELEKTKAELEGLKKDNDHLKSTIDLKSEEIAFLRGHISQLSQIALPPAKEEPVFTSTKTPLWKKLKFWAWV